MINFNEKELKELAGNIKSQEEDLLRKFIEKLLKKGYESWRKVKEEPDGK